MFASATASSRGKSRWSDGATITSRSDSSDEVRSTGSSLRRRLTTSRTSARRCFAIDLLFSMCSFASPRGEMAGHFEIEAERGQVMAEEIVQIAGDAKAFRGAAADLEQLRGHAQLRIGLGQRLPRFHLRMRDVHREEREEREREIDQRVDDRRAVVSRHDEAEDDRVEGDAGDGEARRICAELRGDDHQQHRLKAGGLQRDAGVRRQRLDDRASECAWRSCSPAACR